MNMDKSEFTRELFSKSYLTVETLKKLYKTMKLLVEGFKVKFETVESRHTFSIKIYILKSDLSQEDSAVVKELLKRTV
jgi:hypothetical protein